MAIDTKWSGVIGGAGQGAAVGSAFGGWGAGIGAALGGLGGALLGGGEDDAEELAEMQIREIERAEVENRRRTMLEMGMTLGTARAAIGASNIQFGGTSKKYTDMIESEYRHQMSWDRQRAKVQKEMAALGGQMAVDQMRSSGTQFMLSGIGSAANSGVFGTFEGGSYKAPWS